MKMLFTFVMLSVIININSMRNTPKKVLDLVNISKSAVLAHRGFPGKFPEHAIDGFKEAYFGGADMLEIDIQSTKDNILMVFHDEYLDDIVDLKGKTEFDKYRSTETIEGKTYENKVFFKDVTYGELKDLKITQRFKSRPQDMNDKYGILTLDEFIETFISLNKQYKKTIGFYVEPKSSDYYRSYDKDLDQMLLDTLKRYKLDDYNNFEEFSKFPVVIQTFEVNTLKFYTKLNLPLVSLNNWSFLHNFKELSSMSDAICVDANFVIFERIDDLLFSNNETFSNNEDFVNKCVKEGVPKEDKLITKERMMNQKSNKFINYINSLGLPIIVYTMRDDIPFFNDENPILETKTFYNLGIPIFFCDFYKTCIDAINMKESLESYKYIK